MARLHYLAEEDVPELADRAARIFRDERAFVLRGREAEGLLFSALAQPRWPHHRTLQQKAAALHYSLCLNHPFLDGNKRFALVAMDTFLARNAAWLFASDDELVDFSVKVADHQLSREESVPFVERRTWRFHWEEARTRAWLSSIPLDDLFAIKDVLHSLVTGEPSISAALFADLSEQLTEALARRPARRRRA